MDLLKFCDIKNAPQRNAGNLAQLTDNANNFNRPGGFAG
jgi:hypothetical protein